MGFKLRGVIRCGRCRQPRGIRHVCVARFGTKTRPNRVQSPVTWECPSCHKTRGLGHTCGNKGDFKRRKRGHATEVKRRKRKQATAARRLKLKERNARIRAERKVRERERKAKARARTRTRPPRPRSESHEPGSCGNPECEKYRCVIYWRGMADCPGPHEGEG